MILIKANKYVCVGGGLFFPAQRVNNTVKRNRPGLPVPSADMMQCLQTAAYLKPIKLQSLGLGGTTGAILFPGLWKTDDR